MNIPDVVSTHERKFTVGKLLYTGDLADIYSATYVNGSGNKPVLLKIARDRRDNDLLENEVHVLNHLFPARQKEEKFYRWLPRVLDEGALPDRRHVTALPAFEGFVTMAEVLAAYPQGIDFRDMAWMYKRLLGGLGFVHEMGVVHGAILPPHVLVHPTDHGAKILDWSYALNFAALLQAKAAAAAPPPDPVPPPAPPPVDPQDPYGPLVNFQDPWMGTPDPRTRKKAAAAPPAKAPDPAKPKLSVWDLLRQNNYDDGDPSTPVDPGSPPGAPPDPNKMYVRAISVDYQKFYAPEILRKATPSPATDIYMAAKCAVALLGGNVETNQLPDSVVRDGGLSDADAKRARDQLQAFLQVSLLANPSRRPQDAWQVDEDFDKLLLQLVGPRKYRPFSMPSSGASS